MGTTANGQLNYFTLNKSEFHKFCELVKLQKPEYQDWSITSEFCGWITIHVPKFKGTMPEFYAPLT